MNEDQRSGPDHFKADRRVESFNRLSARAMIAVSQLYDLAICYRQNP